MLLLFLIILKWYSTCSTDWLYAKNNGGCDLWGDWYTEECDYDGSDCDWYEWSHGWLLFDISNFGNSWIGDGTCQKGCLESVACFYDLNDCDFECSHLCNL